MARIEAAPRPGLIARIGYWVARRRVGQVPEPMTVAAHNPSVFKAYAGYEYWLDRAHTMSERLKCLAELRVSTRIGCPF
jgi:hypothetical protein